MIEVFELVYMLASLLQVLVNYIYHVVLQLFISIILQSNSGYTLFNFFIYI